PGLLANDLDVDAASNTGMTASGGSTSTQGGAVTINSNGSFTYDPPVGFTGTDTFTYTATTSGGKTAQATARITVAGKIWFVNNNAGACTSNCNGRLSHPFTSLANFQAINHGSGNTLRGFTVGNTTGTKISGTSFGTLTVGDNTTPDVTLNGTGQALNLTTGTFAATSGFVSVATTSSTAQGISLAGIAG